MLKRSEKKIQDLVVMRQEDLKQCRDTPMELNQEEKVNKNIAQDQICTLQDQNLHMEKDHHGKWGHLSDKMLLEGKIKPLAPEIILFKVEQSKGHR